MVTYDLLVDYDDVLYGCSPRMHTLFERAGITNGKPLTSWHPWEDYECDRQLVIDVLRSATASGELYDGPILPNVLNHLRRLRYAGHRIHIVTARGFGEPFEEYRELIEAMTREQIRNENVPFDSITFTKDKTSVKADFALDDGVHNYEALHAVGVGAFLMDAIHNQEHDTFYRVKSVEEFADWILRLAELEFAA